MSCGIYRIANKINNKCYIGQSIHLEERFKEHLNPYNWKRENHKSLYLAFQKYGVENFTFERLELCESEKLDIAEKKWIAIYNSYKNGYNSTIGGETNSGENHPRHKLTEQDIIDVRIRYANKERKKEVYAMYCDRIGTSGFHKIWNGETWDDIMPEVYTEENRKYHKNDTGNSGSENGRARLTEQDVKNIRLRKKNGETLDAVYQDYKNLLTRGSFANTWRGYNWKQVIV